MNVRETCFVLTVVAISAITCYAGTLKDKRDGKTYKTVMIGGMEWMAQNLDYDYNEGSAISVCYKNKSSNCKKYGRYYTWAAAMDSAAVFSRDGEGCGFTQNHCKTSGMVQGVCPDGWHLPSKEEFEQLVKAAGDANEYCSAGLNLKSRSGWDNWFGNKGNGTDILGFAALPAGYYDVNDSKWQFDSKGTFGQFWTSSNYEYSIGGAYILILSNSDSCARIDFQYVSELGFSVRCVKNN